MFKRFLALSICLGGLVAAQQTQETPQGGPRPRGGPGRGPGGPWREGPGGLTGPMAEQRLTQRLSLNAAQQNTAHTAIEEAKVILKGGAQQERDLRNQLATAVKTGDEAGIERASQNLAALHQQRTSTEAKALAKIYGSLNSDQKTLMDRELGRSLGVAGQDGRGPRTPRQPKQNPQQGAQQ